MTDSEWEERQKTRQWSGKNQTHWEDPSVWAIGTTPSGSRESLVARPWVTRAYAVAGRWGFGLGLKVHLGCVSSLLKRLQSGHLGVGLNVRAYSRIPGWWHPSARIARGARLPSVWFGYAQQCSKAMPGFNSLEDFLGASLAESQHGLWQFVFSLLGALLWRRTGSSDVIALTSDSLVPSCCPFWTRYTPEKTRQLEMEACSKALAVLSSDDAILCSSYA